MMKTTMPAKHKVQGFDGLKLNSVYGGILRSKTRANLIGHLHNIVQFKNRPIDPVDKVTIANFDESGHKIKFKRLQSIDEPDQIYVNAPSSEEP